MQPCVSEPFDNYSAVWCCMNTHVFNNGDRCSHTQALYLATRRHQPPTSHLHVNMVMVLILALRQHPSSSVEFGFGAENSAAQCLHRVQPNDFHVRATLEWPAIVAKGAHVMSSCILDMLQYVQVRLFSHFCWSAFDCFSWCHKHLWEISQINDKYWIILIIALPRKNLGQVFQAKPGTPMTRASRITLI